ncbi:MAG: hypothetical protein WA418_20520 [Bradyrhizobium sp.]
MTVDFGPALTDGSTPLRRKNFFVLDPGAAQREDGFHHFLEGFLGWHLPQVRRYDSPEAKLYLETVFPLFWVEQKFGWSAIPAAIPTYMRIKEVQKRAVEFLLDLEVHDLELRRERLEESIASNAKEWSVKCEELERTVQRSAGRVVALSKKPLADPDALSRAHIEIAEADKWVVLSDVLSRYRISVAAIASAVVPDVEAQSGEVSEKLKSISARVDELNVQRINLHGIQQLKVADIGSLQRRIKTLNDDLIKNLDVQKLQRYSGVAATLMPDRCPTCEQALLDTLLSQEAFAAIMPIGDNIEYIRSQKKMFEDILAREEEEAAIRSDQLAAIGAELAEHYAQIRLLRSELIAPGSNPSASVIEERIRGEAKIRELEALQSVFDESVDRLRVLQEVYLRLLDERERIPSDKLSAGDREKLRLLTELLQSQATEFGFSTFSPKELSISEDSYRPEKEGFEIGFETSASDAIRLKWAYQLSLLELACVKKTNHPNILLFDEPRQQSSSKVSFESLLNRASDAKKNNQQIVFSTSEDIETLQRIIDRIDCTRVIFAGYILQKIE